MWRFRRIGRTSLNNIITNKDFLEKLGTERNILESVKQSSLDTTATLKDSKVY